MDHASPRYTFADTAHCGTRCREYHGFLSTPCLASTVVGSAAADANASPADHLLEFLNWAWATSKSTCKHTYLWMQDRGMSTSQLQVRTCGRAGGADATDHLVGTATVPYRMHHASMHPFADPGADRRRGHHQNHACSADPVANAKRNTYRYRCCYSTHSAYDRYVPVPLESRAASELEHQKAQHSNTRIIVRPGESSVPVVQSDAPWWKKDVSAAALVFYKFSLVRPLS